MSGEPDKSIEALRDHIRAAYEKYSEAIAALSDDELTSPGTCGTWSVRDVIAHVGADEQWMAGQLEALRFDTMPSAASCYGIDTPTAEAFDLTTQDGRNAWQYERLRHLSLDDTRAMAREAHARLLAVISTFDDSQLSEPLAIAKLGTVGWIRSPKDGDQAYPLWEWLRGVTYHHYNDHAAVIRAIKHPASVSKGTSA